MRPRAFARISFLAIAASVSVRRGVGSLVLGLALSTACADSGAEILWDRYGVPHIFGGAEPPVFEAFGWAQAESHGDLLLHMYGESRGRAAEYWGPAHLERDRWVRTLGGPRLAADWYPRLSPAMRAAVDAFARGINRYVERHPDRIADSVEVVAPLTGVDVLAHAIRAVHFTFLARQDQMPAEAASARGDGSNMWAVGPSRSASGHAMLVMNPHLAWADPFVWYEAHLVTRERELYGITWVGLPVPVLAFNRSVGWSHTSNALALDGTDLYRLLKEGDGYRLDGQTTAFDAVTELLAVRLSDGSLRTDTLTVKRSIHGPVVAESDSIAYAIRLTALDRPGMLEQWWDMGAARTVPELEQVVRRLDLPAFNLMAAGRDGHIYYFMGGRTPRRPHGDRAYWSGVVPGDSSATLWTEALDYDSVPSVIDPPSGWLQNTNDPPWSSSYPMVLDPGRYPPYVAPVTMSIRNRWSIQLMRADSSFTFDELVALKHTTRIPLADLVVPELVALARADGRDRALRAADVLEAWDRQALAASRGAVLFIEFVRRWAPPGRRGDLFRVPWSADDPLETPQGLRDPAAALAALVAAAEEVERQHGELDVPWGDVYRIRWAGKDLPAQGTWGEPLGGVRVASYTRDPDGLMRVSGGDGFYAVIEFADPVRAKVLMAYGNATQPDSPHRGDQVELYAAGAMRDAWLDRAVIEANLSRRDAVPRSRR
ncbi:MAG: penicillin acylase family protein [Gemmatimonadales bacterium]